MQEREKSNSGKHSLKRPFPDNLDNNNSKRIKSETHSLPSLLKKQELHYYTTQSGDACAFWIIPNLTKYTEKLFSTWFYTGNGERWRLKLYPDCSGYVGLYLAIDCANKSPWFSRNTTVWMEAWARSSLGKYERKEFNSFQATFEFHKRDWGYENFLDKSKYGFNLRFPIIFEVTVKCGVAPRDSKELTGYIGLVNEGTTCYMNSLLQTLYFLSDFRLAVYSMPTTEQDRFTIPFALQSIFYQLQYNTQAASTRDLLKSFGWSTEEWNVQHDVQEFNCVLSDALESKMKNTQAEGTYSRLFEGQMLNFIECINVNYKSERIEKFIDLQLNVAGCKDITESLHKYCEIEVLSGENQYEADDLGKQDARKGVIFKSLPPVLQIQLKRFEFDPVIGNMVKLNNRFEFYEKIDMNKFVVDEIKGNQEYRLFSVLVHSGSINAGHYYSYISPNLDGNWYKFNDDCVDFALPEQAIENNFGGQKAKAEVTESGDLKTFNLGNDTNAYMLIYVKSSAKENILKSINEEDIPKSLHNLIKDLEESKAFEEVQKLEKSRRCKLFLVTLEMVLDWEGPGISNPNSELYCQKNFSEDKLRRYKFVGSKDWTVEDLKKKLSSHIDSKFRLWSFSPGYKNWEFTELLEKEKLENISAKLDKAIFIEVEDNQRVFKLNESEEWEFIKKEESLNGSLSQHTEVVCEEEGVSAPSASSGHALVFYKWYNQGTLKLVTAAAIRDSANLDQIREDLSSVACGENLTSKVVLHLEKSSSLESKYKEFNSNIHTFMPGDNYKVSCNQPPFGVKHVKIRNGDAFVGEITSESPNAKKHITEIYDNVVITCKHYDKLQKSGYKSYSISLMETNNLATTFPLKTKLSSTQRELMMQLGEIYYEYDDNITWENIQIYSFKSHQRNPTPLPFPYSKEENPKSKKSSINPNLQAIIHNSTTLYFDILPFSVPDIADNDLIYIQYLNQNYEVVDQLHRLVHPNGTIDDLWSSIRFKLLKRIESDSTVNQNEIASFCFFQMTYPQKVPQKEFQSETQLKDMSLSNHMVNCVKVVMQEEEDIRNSSEFSKVVALQYVKNTEIYGSPIVKYFKKETTCKEVVKELQSTQKAKVRVMVCSFSKWGEEFEYKPSRLLEESEEAFFEKYEKRVLALEHPAPTGTQGLRFKP